jgi:hypothetical protein
MWLLRDRVVRVAAVRVAHLTRLEQQDQLILAAAVVGAVVMRPLPVRVGQA